MNRTRKVVSLILLLGAALWTADILRQLNQANGDGPPMGALCMGGFSAILLIAAGAVWPSRRKP